MNPISGSFEGLLIDDRYRLVREIGRGGMGVVYEAHDKILDRSVALKFLDVSRPDGQFRERFGNEAAVLARVASRHIVAIHDYGSHEGTPYLVTQLVPDGDLHSRINLQGAMAPAEAVDMALQICEALADAHAEGILHRDIKPANVLLHRQRRGFDRAFLCDFGIAASETTEFTQTGAVVGTTSYLAPERLNGASASVATDIYSLGCLVWAMLTGQAPYAGTEFQVMDAHVNAPPPQFVVDTPFAEAINDFLLRAMAKDPAQRLASASAAGDVLTGLLPAALGMDAGELTPQDPEPTGSARGSSHGDGDTRLVTPGGLVPPAAGADADASSDATRYVERPLVPGPVAPGDPVTPAAPASADRTVIRPSLGSAAAVGAGSTAGGGTTGERATGAASAPADASADHRKPRPKAALLALAAVVVVLGVVAALLAASGDDEPTRATSASISPSPAPEPTAPPTSVEPSPTAAPLSAVPKVKASAAYRSVVFSAAEPPDGRVLQRLDERGEWREVNARSRKATPMGGDRVCARFRYATAGDPDSAATGEPVQVCGRSQPPSIDLIRTTIPCTSDNQAPGCRYYNITAAGFEPGSRPLVYLYTAGTTLFCPACVPRPMVMDDSGRGRHDGPRPSSLGEVQITPSSTYPRVTVEIDGVRRTFELL